MGKSCDMLLLLVNGHEDGRDIAQRTGEVSHSFEPKPERMAKYDVSMSDMAALSRADEIASVLEWFFPVVISGKNAEVKRDTLAADLERLVGCLLTARQMRGLEKSRMLSDAGFWRGRISDTLKRCVTCENLSETACDLIERELTLLTKVLTR